MTQQAREAIDFDAECRLSDAVNGPLIASVRRFQLGESGDGAQLPRKAAEAGDLEYLSAARLGCRRTRFIRDVLADFSKVVPAVLRRGG
jgi:hypothetical protein